MTPLELRKWLEVNQISGGPLAKLLRVDRTTVYRWINGVVAMPADLENQLGAALAIRDAAISQESEFSTPSCPLGFEPASETPHGQVIGLKKSFWTQTETAREAWISAAEHPMWALPWPWWSPGWSYWPPSQWYPERYPDKKKMPPPARQEPHWVSVEAIRVAKTLGRDDGLRIGIMRLCRRDRPTWMDKREGTTIPEEYLVEIKKIVEG